MIKNLVKNIGTIVWYTLLDFRKLIFRGFVTMLGMAYALGSVMNIVHFAQCAVRYSPMWFIDTTLETLTLLWILIPGIRHAMLNYKKELEKIVG